MTMTRSLCLLLVMSVTISHVEANIFTDVLSWVGLGAGGSVEKEEKAKDEIDSGERVSDNDNEDDIVESESNNDGEQIDKDENDDNKMEEEEEATGRIDEL